MGDKPHNTTVTLAVNGDSVTLPMPQRGPVSRHVYAQAAGRTAAGDLFVYDKDVDYIENELTFVLTRTQRDNLVAWFETHAEGMVNTFTYTDQWNSAFAGCRFLDPTLEFTKTPGAQWAVMLRFQSSSEMR